MIRLSRAVLPICIAAILLFVAAAGCNYLPEASFELANESRLPVWFNLSPGLSRADVSVTMRYYVRTTGRTATFILRDRKNHILGEVNGTLRGDAPIFVNASSVKHNSEYPSFEVITAQGIPQLLEHKKMEPIFYVVDDPAFLRALIDAPLNESTLPTPTRK